MSINVFTVIVALCVPLTNAAASILGKVTHALSPICLSSQVHIQTDSQNSLEIKAARKPVKVFDIGEPLERDAGWDPSWPGIVTRPTLQRLNITA